MHESRMSALFGEMFRSSEGHIRPTAKDPGENADTDRQWKDVKCLNQGIRGQFDDGTSQPGCTLCENTASLPVCHRGCVAVRVHKIARQACLHAPTRRLRLREQADQVCLASSSGRKTLGHRSTPTEQMSLMTLNPMMIRSQRSRT